MLTKAVEQFLARRRTGASSTTCSSTCRPAPGTCRWVWPGCSLARRPVDRDDTGARRAEGRCSAGGRHGEALSFLRVCRRDREHECVHLRPRSRPTPCSARAVAVRPSPTRSACRCSGKVPLEPSVAAGGDAGDARVAQTAAGASQPTCSARWPKSDHRPRSHRRPTCAGCCGPAHRPGERLRIDCEAMLRSRPRARPEPSADRTPRVRGSSSGGRSGRTPGSWPRRSRARPGRI